MELESEVEESRAAGGILSSTPTPSTASTLNASGQGMWNDSARKDLERKLAQKCEYSGPYLPWPLAYKALLQSSHL